MFSDLKYIPSEWRKAWRNPGFRNQTVISVLLFILAGLHAGHYLRIWQDRNGLQLNDPILNLLPPHDFSNIIFILEYSTVLVCALFLAIVPSRFIKGLQMYVLLMFLRTFSIYLLPLEPPQDMIFLFDPFAQTLLHSNNVLVTKDLFFSGHTSTLFLFMLMAHNKALRWYAAAATVIVGILLLSQHVHYSIDIIGAPFASYFCYLVISRFHMQTRYGLEFEEANSF